jgi:MerR family transcriptional regulator, light-induced transcriptional regulator
MATTPLTSSPAKPLRLRSGTAARLAGLPVTTLRVWERRYGVVPGAKTENGQRIYSAHDVSRLRLLRHLARTGHAIGTIATLELEELQALAEGLPSPTSLSDDRGLLAVVIGRSAAKALEAVHGCGLCVVYEDLDQAEAASRPTSRIDLLVVRLASLQPTTAERVLAYAAVLGVRSILVIYAFGTEASARTLADSGVTVRRDPIVGRELAQWVRDARLLPGDAQTGWQVLPRRFSDAELGQFTTMQSPVSCECLRHMAELVTQLAGFERYSQDCASEGPADAALHRELCRTAGVARTMFEKSLQRVVANEVLDSHEQLAR